jgi:hypothetical protein
MQISEEIPPIIEEILLSQEIEVVDNKDIIIPEEGPECDN